MKKGLIVDDAAVMRLRLKDILGAKYSIVAEAENGIEALEKYRTYMPDFVTMDISMAEMNGIETLASMLREFPEAKIVMVSAVGQKQLVFEALGMGAKDFIVKPFDRERVEVSIDRIFK